MKCVKNIKTEEIKRVSTMFADQMVASGQWMFVPRKEWKVKVRDKK